MKKKRKEQLKRKRQEREIRRIYKLYGVKPDEIDANRKSIYEQYGKWLEGNWQDFKRQILSTFDSLIKEINQREGQ